MTHELPWITTPIYCNGRATGYLPVTRTRELPSSEVARLYRAVRSGQVVPIRPGAFAPVDAWQDLSHEDRHRVRVYETVAALSAPLVVSHESAAIMHGIPLLGPLTDAIHVTRPRRGGGWRSDYLIHHPAQGKPQTVSMAGMQLTSPARTVMDLARTGSFARGLIAADHCLSSGLATLKDLQAQAQPQLPGAARLRLVATHATALSESPGESLTRARFLHLHAPMPTLQAHVVVRGRHYRLDFLWEDLGVVGEFDGALKYASSAQQSSTAVYQEKRREDDLRTRFRTVIRFSWDDVLRIDPLEHELRRVGVLAGASVRDARYL